MTTYNILISKLTDVYTTEEIKVGTKYEDTAGAKYLFVYNAGAASTAADDVCGCFLTTPVYGHISMTAATQSVSSDATTTVTVVSGIALSTIATTEYGWIQVGGPCSTGVTTDDSIDVGDQMYCADNAKVATTVQAAHQGNMAFGWSPAADGGTTLSFCYLDCAWNW